VDLAPSRHVTRAPRTRGTRLRIAALRTAVGLAFGAVLVLAFVRLVNMGGVYHRLQHLSIGLALLCGAAFLSAYVVRALRWRCLLRPCRVTVRRAVAIYYVAIFLNWLLPIRGGELAMSLLLRHTNGIPVSRSLPAVSMDKAMDLIPVVVLLAVLPVTPLRLGGPLWILLLSTLALLVVAGGVLVLAAWRPKQTQAILIRPVTALLPARVRGGVEGFVATFAATFLALVRRPRLLLIAAALTVVALCLDALFCLLAFRAVGVVVPVWIVLYGYTFFNLSFILPSPPGQVGSNELIGLLIFSGSFGISRTGVGAMFLFSHPWTGFLMTCTGLACLSMTRLTMHGALSVTQNQGQLPTQERREGPTHTREELEEA
jgi:uncharacterized protein (TIRG00374 family)